MNLAASKLKIPLLVVILVAGIGSVYGYFRLRGAREESSTAGPHHSEPGAPKVLAAGSVEATGEGADLARQIGTVFVILRDEKPGPPYAVARLKNSGGQKTLNFLLTEEDIMMKGQPPPMAPVLKVRFDSDGDPMTELPHDLSGALKGFVLGERDLHLSARLVGHPSASSQ